MKEQLVSFETAKLAKEKGFNIPTTQFYKSGKKPYLTEVEGYMTDQFVVSNWNNGNGSYPTRPEDVSCSAPTQSLLQKWLREVHNIHIIVISNSKNQYFVDYRFSDQRIDNDSDLILLNGLVYKTYEQALEKGLQEALKLI